MLAAGEIESRNKSVRYRINPVNMTAENSKQSTVQSNRNHVVDFAAFAAIALKRNGSTHHSPPRLPHLDATGIRRMQCLVEGEKCFALSNRLRPRRLLPATAMPSARTADLASSVANRSSDPF
jgi:hypothetical protein